jgi:hypothetical protein
MMKMKQLLPVLLFVACVTAAWAEDRIPATMLPKSVEMEVALRAYLAATDMKLLAEVSVKNAGSFTLGVDAPGIGKTGEKIHKMELMHLDGRVHGLVLVNETTKTSHVVFPKKAETKTPNPASEAIGAPGAPQPQR